MRRRRGAWIEAFSQAFAFFGGTMASFAALAIRNFTTFLGAILMASPVAGLRPMRALRFHTDQSPYTGQHEYAILLDLTDSRLRQGGEQALRDFLGNLALLCQCLDDLRLRHCSPFRTVPMRQSYRNAKTF